VLSGKKSLVKKLKEWSSHDSFYHVLFWVLLFFVMLVTSMPRMGFYTAFITDVINVGFFALIAYFNYLFLLPRYLKDKNLFLHFLFLVVASLLLTPIKTFFLYQVSSGNNELQSYYLNNQTFIFISTLFVGAMATIFRIMNEWTIQQKDKKELESQTLQSELKFLKSQINPHFLFNTLNSLYALTLKKSDLAPAIVLKLAEMMRYMRYECNEKEVLLSKEINYLKNYLELEKLRHGNNMDIDLKITGEIEKQKIAPLILIPFIENSFKHGANNQIGQGYVNFDLDVHQNELRMKLENSKTPSLPKALDKRSGGIGLVNVKRRMEIIYPNKHHLNILESPNTYKIELNLNLETNN